MIRKCFIKRVIVRLFSYAIIMAGIYSVSFANIEDYKKLHTNVNIAVVDYEKLLNQSIAFKDWLKYERKQSVLLEKKYKSVEAGIAKDIDDLRRKKDTISLKAIKEKEDEINKRIIRERNKVFSSTNRIAKIKNLVLSEILSAFKDISQRESKKNKYTMIANLSSFFYIEPSMDITDSIITKLNKQLPSINIKKIEQIVDKSISEKKLS